MSALPSTSMVEIEVQAQAEGCEEVTVRTTRSQDIDLSALLTSIHEGAVALPNFQRDFDWTDVDVRSLLGTVLNGWPLGSLLLIDGASEEYAVRPFEYAPNLSRDIDFIVLDGQQRLTALYHAFFGRGPLVYSLKIDFNLDYGNVDNLDEALEAHPRARWEDSYLSPAIQWERSKLPLSALNSASDFFEWRDAAIPDEQAEARAEITEIYRYHLSGVHRYKMPAVIISRDIASVAVARIFERVNRTGMPLFAFDLMVARSFGDGFNLRVEWDNAKAKYPVLERFLKDDGLPILSTIALRGRKDIRQSAVLELPGTAIRDAWQATLANFVSALNFAYDELGIVHADWLAYKPILPVLAALNADAPLAERRDLIAAWYWSTVLGTRYDVASNTRAVADFENLRKSVDAEWRVVLDKDAILSSTRRRNGAFHRGYMTLLTVQSKRVLPWSGGYSSNDPRDDLRASSVFARDIASGLEPPAHLRTLTFALRHADGSLATEPHGHWDFWGPELVESFLEERWNKLIAELTALTRRPPSIAESALED